MRRLILAVSLAVAAAPALAVGPLDGAYQCAVSIGNVPEADPVFIVILGHADGAAAYGIIAAVKPNVERFGYGIGRVDAGGRFTGNNSFGKPFAFSRVAGTDRLAGSVLIANISSVWICTQIW